MLDRLMLIGKDGYSPRVIIDVGAHVGAFYKECKNLWPASEVHMVEPNPFARQALLSIDNKVYSELLSHTAGQSCTYYMTDKWNLSSGNSIYREATSDFSDDHLQAITLQTSTLDNLFSNLPVIDVLKLDTQGSEVDILTGGLSVVSKVKYIIVEASVYEYNKGGCKIGDVFSFMNTHNFELVDILDLSYLEDGSVLNQVDLLFKTTHE